MIFVLVALVVIAAIIILLLIRSPQEEDRPTTFPTAELENAIETCIEENARGAINKLKSQGGFLNEEDAPLGILEVDSDQGIIYRTAYGFKEGRSNIISNEGLTFQIERYVDETLPRCANLERPGYTIQGSPQTTASLSEEQLSLVVSYQVTLKKGEASARTKELYEKTISTQIEEMRRTAEIVARSQEENEGLLDLAETLSTELNIQLVPINEQNTIFIIYSSEGKPGFTFASEAST